MKKFSFNLLASICLLLVSLCSSAGKPGSSGVAVAEDNGVHVRGSSLRRATILKKKKKKKKKKVPKAAKSKRTKAAKSEKSPKSVHACASIITQKDSLLALKAGFTNGGAVLTDWVSTTDPCDVPWNGITCDGDKVTQITLRT